jgi:hypothetical protein
MPPVNPAARANGAWIGPRERQRVDAARLLSRSSTRACSAGGLLERARLGGFLRDLAVPEPKRAPPFVVKQRQPAALTLQAGSLSSPSMRVLTRRA